MSKKMKQLIMALLVIVMSVTILAIPAAADTKYTASIPVEVRIDPNYVPVVEETFEILVTPGSADFPMPANCSNGIYKIVGADTGSLDFTLPGLGVYTYEISQVDRDSKDDCYEDDSVYDLTIYVLNEDSEHPSQGGIVVQVTLKLRGDKDDTKPATALFINKYAKPVQAAFAATKIYNDKTPKTDLFDFQLKNAKGELLQTVSNVGKNVNFKPIVFDEEGVYTYTISEVLNTRPGVIYDESVYKVTVTVTRDIANKGNYEAKVTYEKNDKTVEADDVVFVNKSKTGGNPFTGDLFRMGLWLSVMAISLVGILVLLVVWFKNKKK